MAIATADFIKQIDEGLYDRMLKVRKSNEKVTDALKANRLSREDELALGEILFNNQSLASGSYSCARCHVPGAAFGKAYTSFSRVPMSAFGPDLAGVENEATQQQHFDLVNTGMVPGIGYFSRKQGNPQMPAFGTNPNAGQADKGIPDKGPEGMLSIEQLWAVVRYERNLSNDSTVKSAVAGTAESPTFAGGK